MGRKAKTLKLIETARLELNEGYKHSTSPQFSRRCLILLLKNKELTSNDIGELLGITDQSVNNWVKRYEAKGIAGLKTKSGQGRKPIFNKEEDEKRVRAILKKERQRLKLAKEEIEQKCGKEFSLITLKRFLKTLSADGNGFG
jgi:transposase